MSLTKFFLGLLMLGLGAGAIAVGMALQSCDTRMPGFTGCVDYSAHLTIEGRRVFRGIFQSQQAYYQEHHTLAASWNELDTMVLAERSPQFDYALQSTPSAIFISSTPRQPTLPVRVRFLGWSWMEYHSVRSAVMAIALPRTPDAPLSMIVCENLMAGVLQPEPPTLQQQGHLTCAASTQSVQP